MIITCFKSTITVDLFFWFWFFKVYRHFEYNIFQDLPSWNRLRCFGDVSTYASMLNCKCVLDFVFPLTTTISKSRFAHYSQDHYLPAYGFVLAFCFQIISYCAIGTVIQISVTKWNEMLRMNFNKDWRESCRFRMIIFTIVSFAVIGSSCPALTSSNISF